MIAAVFAGALADLIGRRNTLYIACIVSIGSVFMLVFAPPGSFAMILVGRMVNGAASALFNCIAASYTSELSPLPIRGLTTGGLNIWIVGGQL
jgi:MFS family permease